MPGSAYFEYSAVTPGLSVAAWVSKIKLVLTLRQNGSDCDCHSRAVSTA